MRVYKCDRCGREFGTLRGVLFFACGFTAKTHTDLCPDCLKSFKRWLKGKEEEQEGQE